MIINFRRAAMVTCLVALSAGSLGTIPVADASTATVPSAVAKILASTDSYITSIRTYFLCNSVTCKQQRTTLLHDAQVAMAKLTAQTVALPSTDIASKYDASLKLFFSDVTLLLNSFDAYFTTTSTVTMSGDVGNIFYLTSDIGSDVNVLRALSQNAHVTFKLWVEGEAATLVAMQTDASALQSSSATTQVGIMANQLLEQECHVMISHASGPNATFDSQLVHFANDQAKVSDNEILFLRGKVAQISEAQVAALNVKVAAEFAALVKSETALIKK